MAPDTTTKKNCAWHECNKLFRVKHASQEYCTSQCRIKRNTWKAHRGAPLVDMLLEEDWTGLVQAGRIIKNEITEAKELK